MISGDVLKRSDSRELEPKAETVAFPIQNLHSISRLVEKDEEHGNENETLISSPTSAARPSMDFRKSTGLGYRFTFSTFASGRIMANRLLRESGAQHRSLTIRWE